MARNKYPEVTVGRILDASEKLFLEKGYDNTTIQDIIDALGDLSKGAIYHHFKSKEDIMDALTTRMCGVVDILCEELMSNKELNGLEKIRELLYITLENPVQKTLLDVMPNMLKNPKLLVMQIDITMNKLANDIMVSFIKTGIADGSVKTDYPKELAEVIALLINIWLNPFVFKLTLEEAYRKCMFLKQMTEAMGLNIFDERIINAFKNLSIEHKSSI